MIEAYIKWILFIVALLMLTFMNIHISFDWPGAE